MRILLIIPLCFISILVIGQTAFNPILNNKNDTVFKEGENKPYTGKYQEHYPGDIKVKGQFINGLKNGEFIYYNNTTSSFEYGFCSIDSIINYKEGKKEGVQKGFFFCPQESYRKNFKNGLLNGYSYYWDISGQLVKIETYENNSLVDNKDIDIDSNLANIVIEIKGFKGDTLSKSKILKSDTLKLIVTGEFYTEDGYLKLPLKEYEIKSFIWSSYRPGSDYIYKVNGNVLPDKLTKIIKDVLKQDKDWKFWIQDLIIIDPNKIEYQLKEFMFLTE